MRLSDAFAIAAIQTQESFFHGSSELQRERLQPEKFST